MKSRGRPKGSSIGGKYAHAAGRSGVSRVPRLSGEMRAEIDRGWDYFWSRRPLVARPSVAPFIS